MDATVTTAATLGMGVHIVRYEAHPRAARTGLDILGIDNPHAAQRITDALSTVGVNPSTIGVSVARLLSMAPLGRDAHDLAIACAAYAAHTRTALDLGNVAILGGLDKSGRVVSVPGILPIVTALADSNLDAVIVAHGNVTEARMVRGIRVIGVGTLTEAVRVLASSTPVAPIVAAATFAAAGGFHVALAGDQEAAWDFADVLTALLPNFTQSEQFEAAVMDSHRTLTVAGLPARPRLTVVSSHTPVGELLSAGINQPGAIIGAHLGVLCVPDAHDHQPGVIRALISAMEHGSITLHRSDGAVTFPARFTLVTSAPKCDCAGVAVCSCRTNGRPLLRHPSVVDLTSTPPGEAPTTMAAATTAVARARAMAKATVGAETYASASWTDLAAVTPKAVLDATAASARGPRAVREAWTRCAIAGRTAPTVEDLA